MFSEYRNLKLYWWVFWMQWICSPELKRKKKKNPKEKTCICPLNRGHHQHSPSQHLLQLLCPFFFNWFRFFRKLVKGCLWKPAHILNVSCCRDIPSSVGKPEWKTKIKKTLSTFTQQVSPRIWAQENLYFIYLFIFSPLLSLTTIIWVCGH